MVKRDNIRLKTRKAALENGHFIGTIRQADEWQRSNKYIKNGYRIGYNTNSLALRSLFQIHNETSNVWSHLLGSLLFVAMGIYVAMYMHTR
jgi:hypothetical protein